MVDDSGVRKIARELYQLYHAALFTEVSRFHNHHRVPALRQQPFSVHRHFLAAAQTCCQLDATPRRYLLAQLAAFDEYSLQLGKRILPMPQHLYGMAAQVRFLRHQEQQLERSDRVAHPEQKQVRGFFREERHLRGLVRIMRETPDDVLVSRPREFSPEFLRARRVWHLVEDQFD